MRRPVRSMATGIICCFFVALFHAGCATDRVAVDLVNYINQDILSIASLEQDALGRYASVTGKNYTSAAAVRDALKTGVIPRYSEFVRLLRTFRPETDEVRRLHGIYLKGADLLLNGFKTKLAGLEKDDEFLIRTANAQIEKGRMENENWRRQLSELYVKHGVAEKGAVSKKEKTK